MLRRAYKKSCPISCLRWTTKPWSNAELMKLRADTRKLSNLPQGTKNEESWKLYRFCIIHYRNKIRKAKRESTKVFSDSITDVEADCLRMVLAEKLNVQSNIRKTDGSWAESNRETLELLMSTHFPGCGRVRPEDCDVEE